MKIDIEDFAKEKGEKIANTILQKYSENLIVNHRSFWGSFLDELLGGSYSHSKIKKDLFNRALIDATDFFLENELLKSDNEILETLRFRLETRLRYPKTVKKMTPEKLLANVICIHTKDFLLESDCILD